MQVIWGQILSQVFSNFFFKSSTYLCLYSQSFSRLGILYPDLNPKIQVEGIPFCMFTIMLSWACRSYPHLTFIPLPEVA